MSLLKIVLYPFAVIYDLVTRFRNHLYNIDYKKSFRFDVVTINVGNLSVGGTGKTPMIEYLIRLLHKDFTLATLSRGYGRKTKGFRLASKEDTAATIGDEPYQFHLKYGEDIKVAVGEERAFAIPKILFEVRETEIILLDDAYQHRSVDPHINILLTDYNHPFFKDYLLPAGRLREARKGAQRADIIIVTKCPDELIRADRDSIRKEIDQYSKPGSPVFFTTVRYGTALLVTNNQHHRLTNDVILFTGIANSKPLVQYVSAHFNLIKHISYSDHYAYKSEDIMMLKREVEQAGKDVSLLTTEKDSVRLLYSDLRLLVEQLPFFYLPITVELLEGQATFEKMIMNRIRKSLGG